jgi:hypothetical protein
MLALAAAALAAVPLRFSRIDGDADLDSFFVILAGAAVVVALLLGRDPAGRRRVLTARAIAVAWLIVGAVILVLLGMSGITCGCSSPDPASLPPAPTLAGLPATAFHVLATYGGGLLVAIAAFVPRRSHRRSERTRESGGIPTRG